MASGQTGECSVHYFRGVAALCGAAVDQVAQAGLASVPEEWQAQRRRRDGDAGFHVTFLTKGDLQAVATGLREGSLQLPKGQALPNTADLASVAELASRLVAAQPCAFLWVDAGEGRCRDEQGEAAFRVVFWPAGAAARRMLALEPQDFHISLGFRGHDVHGRSKGHSSLLGGVPAAAAVPRLAAAARQLLETTPGREADSQGVEGLCDAALLGARAAGDAQAEQAALRALCLLCGRFARHQECLQHAGQLLELCAEDEVACRSRAFSLMALQRYSEAWPALAVLERISKQMSEGKEGAAVEKWLSSALEKCKSKLGDAATDAGSRLFPGNEDAATEEGDRLFEEDFHGVHSKLKFPSTAHLKNLGAATRDDKVCDATRQRLFCGSGKLVTVEEKVDGANLGISLDSSSQWRMQARSKMVNWKTDTQFAGLEQWLNEHSSTLCEVLERNNDILFGEWCFARHTVKYTRLPGYFLAFDIYDKRQGRFLSRKSFHTRLQRATGPKIPAVPTVCTARTFGSLAEVEALLERQSAFADEFLEGVYLRIDEAATSGAAETFLLDRCKLVRSEFQQAIDDHGTWRGSGRNQLDMDLVMSYAEQSYTSAAHSVCLTMLQEETQAAPSAKSKYPSTPHLPFSPGVNPDDSRLADCAHLLMQEVVVTEKLDGGNCCIKGGQVFARTHAKPATHESFSAVKQLAAGVSHLLGDVELFGENMEAVHSIEYGNLTSFFYAFAARRRGQWLSWDEIVELAELLGVPTVPIVYRGNFTSMEHLQSRLEAWALAPSAVGGRVTPEGFVVRSAGGWPEAAFANNVAKYVRADHIQTDDTWTRSWKKAELGSPIDAAGETGQHCPNPLRQKLLDPRQRHKVNVASLGEVELPRNFSFLLDDVAVSSTPKNARQIAAMGDMGISLVVTLTEEEPLPSAWFQGTSVKNVFVPVANYHPPSVEQTDEILKLIAGVALEGKSAMVHCGGGKGRAGTVAACLMLRYGMECVGEAVKAERDAGSTFASNAQSDDILRSLRDARPGSVETAHQEQFIREYASLLWRRQANTPASSSSAGKAAEQAKQRDKEAERRLRELQKRAPKYVMMAGLAGSGKSTFCKALEASGTWVRANQDDLGRKGCIDLVQRTVPQVRQRKARLVVDRCNLVQGERAEWLDMLGSPAAKEITCVFFDLGAESCKQRAAARQNHPTIRAGGGGRIIDEQAKQLERPKTSEGFGAVEVVRNYQEAAALLRRWGASPMIEEVEEAGPAHARGDHEQAAAPEVTEEEGAAEEQLIPAMFAEWLRTAVAEELGDSEAEALLPALEVILAGAAEDPEATTSAAEVLRDAGAVLCSEKLQARWQMAC